MACDYSDGDVETGGSLHLAKPASLGEVRSKEEKIVRKGKGCKRKNVFLKRKSPEKCFRPQETRSQNILM